MAIYIVPENEKIPFCSGAGAKETAYECALCDHFCIDEKKYVNHLSLNHKANFLPCAQCGKLYSTPRHLLNHMKKMNLNPTEVLYCGSMRCHFKTTISTKFISHIQNCDSGTFSCYHCKAIFTVPSNLLLHLSKVGESYILPKWQKLTCFTIHKKFLPSTNAPQPIQFIQVAAVSSDVDESKVSASKQVKRTVNLDKSSQGDTCPKTCKSQSNMKINKVLLEGLESQKQQYMTQLNTKSIESNHRNFSYVKFAVEAKSDKNQTEKICGPSLHTSPVNKSDLIVGKILPLYSDISKRLSTSILPKPEMCQNVRRSKGSRLINVSKSKYNFIGSSHNSETSNLQNISNVNCESLSVFKDGVSSSSTFCTEPTTSVSTVCSASNGSDNALVFSKGVKHQEDISEPSPNKRIVHDIPYNNIQKKRTQTEYKWGIILPTHISSKAECVTTSTVTKNGKPQIIYLIPPKHVESNGVSKSSVNRTERYNFVEKKCNNIIALKEVELVPSKSSKNSIFSVSSCELALKNRPQGAIISLPSSTKIPWAHDKGDFQDDRLLNSTNPIYLCNVKSNDADNKNGNVYAMLKPAKNCDSKPSLNNSVLDEDNNYRCSEYFTHAAKNNSVLNASRKLNAIKPSNSVVTSDILAISSNDSVVTSDILAISSDDSVDSIRHPFLNSTHLTVRQILKKFRNKHRKSKGVSKVLQRTPSPLVCSKECSETCQIRSADELSMPAITINHLKSEVLYEVPRITPEYSSISTQPLLQSTVEEGCGRQNCFIQKKVSSCNEASDSDHKRNTSGVIKDAITHNFEFSVDSYNSSLFFECEEDFDNKNTSKSCTQYHNLCSQLSTIPDSFSIDEYDDKSFHFEVKSNKIVNKTNEIVFSDSSYVNCFEETLDHALALSHKKSQNALQEMLSSSKVVDSFKCMGFFCTFTSNCYENFTKHCEEHGMEVLECAYCFTYFLDAKDLVNHIISEHGRSTFQCSMCFYRACSRTHVWLHQQEFHCGQRTSVIKNSLILTSSSAVNEETSFENKILSFECCFEKCAFSALDLLDMVLHVIYNHCSTNYYNCRECSHHSLTLSGWIAHIQVHGIHLFHCSYCAYGCENRLEIMKHLCLFHMDNPLISYVRTTPSFISLLEYYLNLSNEDDYVQNCPDALNCFCFLMNDPKNENIQQILVHVKNVGCHFAFLKCLYCAYETSSILEMEVHLQFQHPEEDKLKYYCSKPVFKGISNLPFSFIENIFSRKSYAMDKSSNIFYVKGISSQNNCSNTKPKSSKFYSSLFYFKKGNKYIDLYMSLPKYRQNFLTGIRRRMLISLLNKISSKMNQKMESRFECLYCQRKEKHMSDLRQHWRYCHVQSGKKFRYTIKQKTEVNRLCDAASDVKVIVRCSHSKNALQNMHSWGKKIAFCMGNVIGNSPYQCIQNSIPKCSGTSKFSSVPFNVVSDSAIKKSRLEEMKKNEYCLPIEHNCLEDMSLSHRNLEKGICNEMNLDAKIISSIPKMNDSACTLTERWPSCEIFNACTSVLRPHKAKKRSKLCDSKIGTLTSISNSRYSKSLWSLKLKTLNHLKLKFYIQDLFLSVKIPVSYLMHFINMEPKVLLTDMKYTTFKHV